MPYFKIYEAVCHPQPSGFGEWDWMEAIEYPELEGTYPSKEDAIAAWKASACFLGLDVKPDDEVSGRLHRQGDGSVYTTTNTQYGWETVSCVWAEEVDCAQS